jgi:restriction system protein
VTPDQQESAHVDFPTAFSLTWPTLQALARLGGSARIEEITPTVADLIGLSEQQQAIPWRNGSRSKLEYRLAWARTYLKNIGAVEKSSRGVWSITEVGRGCSEADVLTRYRSWRAAEQLVGLAVVDDATDDSESEAIADLEDDWKRRLLNVIGEMDPLAFERLFVRVLREAGFVNVKTTRSTGDDGIDGTGVYNLSLISFPVYFQCKRWKRAVGSEEMRNFRGAMIGRAEHALFVTTSSFTSNAKDEAIRAGAPPIDMIDGERLCDFLRDFSLGVSVTTRTVSDITIVPDFFDDV